MNKLLCKITGGHRYADKNLRTYNDDKRRLVWVSNWCCKCGEEYTYKIPYDRFYTQSELQIMGIG